MAQSQTPPLEANQRVPVAETSVVAAPALAAPRAQRKSRPFLILGGLVLVILIGIAAFMLLTAGEESTDDAQVAADLVPIGARVAGQISQVAIVDNQRVARGDLIATIDDADYAARVAQAEAEVASARAQAAQADAQVSIVSATSKGGLSSAKAAYSGSSVGVAAADASVASAQAQIARAEADARKADNDLKRATSLHAQNAITEERFNDAQAAAEAAAAGLAQARAVLVAAQESRRAAVARVSEAAGRVAESAPIEAQVAAAEANAELAHARIRAAEAALDGVKLQLSYTQIRAPSDGVASQLSVRPGQLVAPGQPIVQLVPSGTYVIANFKETQMARMRVGQPATIGLDAYPHREFHAKVESISGGTGATFSLLPPDNASGNFVKVVQRVPVRLAWVDAPADVALIAGLSADVVVHVGK